MSARLVAHRGRQLNQGAIANSGTSASVGTAVKQIRTSVLEALCRFAASFREAARRSPEVLTDRSSPGRQRFRIAAAGTDLMLKRAQPPAQFLEVRFAMLVRERVDDVFNFRSPLLQRFKQQRTTTADFQRQRADSSRRQASISLRNWLTVTTSVRWRKLPSRSTSPATALSVSAVL